MTIHLVPAHLCAPMQNFYVYLIKIGSVSPGGEVPITAAAFPRWMATAILWCM